MLQLDRADLLEADWPGARRRHPFQIFHLHDRQGGTCVICRALCVARHVESKSFHGQSKTSEGGLHGHDIG